MEPEHTHPLGGEAEKQPPPFYRSPKKPKTEAPGKKNLRRNPEMARESYNARPHSSPNEGCMAKALSSAASMISRSPGPLSLMPQR